MASFVESSQQIGPVATVPEVGMEEVIRQEIQTFKRKDWTVRLPEPNKSQACEVCTLEEPDEWWSYQQKIGNSFPLLNEV